MRHITTFTGPSVGLTKPYEYQVMELDTLGRVQLWYKEPGQRWHVGHGKDIPSGSTAGEVAHLMRLFIQGDLSHETYNQLLPG
jgi:hypothetical protein